MKPTCQKCGAELAEDATRCPKCGTLDPSGTVTDAAERFNEEQVEIAGKPPKEK